MFQFNFHIEDNSGEVDTMESTCDDLHEMKKEWFLAKKHFAEQRHLAYLCENSIVEEVMIGQTKLRYLSMQPAVDKLMDSGNFKNLEKAFESHSDLIPAIYEGGLKIWECTWDLLHHLNSQHLSLKGCKVLELGCGAALPAIFCALKGAHITVQDYNEEVINAITIPNVILNVHNATTVSTDNETMNLNIQEGSLDSLAQNARFYSGDWGSLGNCLLDSCLNTNSGNDSTLQNSISNESETNMGNILFDLILSCETIYNPDCHLKLLNLLTKCLKPNGKIYLAAKVHYFGVGGGIHQFTKLVATQQLLDIQSHVTNDDGVKREILEMKFVNP